jgi:hypothetical protein
MKTTGLGRAQTAKYSLRNKRAQIGYGNAPLLGRANRNAFLTSLESSTNTTQSTPKEALRRLTLRKVL